MKRILLTSSLLLLLGYVWADNRKPQAPKQAGPLYVSMVQLIANPEPYDGEKVVVIGFLELANEADLLYLHEDDFDNKILTNTVWVDASEQMAKEKKNISYKYVRIEGTFTAGSKDRNGFSVGVLKKVTSCMMYSDPDEIFRSRLKNASNPK